jgi:hypothetical protein
MKKRGKKSGQKLESEKTQVYAQRPRLKMPFKNSVSILCCATLLQKKGGGCIVHTVHANLLADKDCRLLYSSQKVPVVFAASKIENNFTR